MKYSVLQIRNAIDYLVWIGKTNYCQRKELELVCEFMKWPFRELMFCIHQVLHVFSKSREQLLVASVINPESWGNPQALTRSILPWELPSSLLLSNSALCRGFGPVPPVPVDQMQSLLEVCRSPVLSSGWTLDSHDSLLSSLVSIPLWTLSLNLYPGMSNESCSKPSFLSNLSHFCRTGWGHCLFLRSLLTSSLSSLFLAVPYTKFINKLKIMRMVRLAITVYSSQQ